MAVTLQSNIMYIAQNLTYRYGFFYLVDNVLVTCHDKLFMILYLWFFIPFNLMDGLKDLKLKWVSNFPLISQHHCTLWPFIILRDLIFLKKKAFQYVMQKKKCFMLLWARLNDNYIKPEAGTISKHAIWNRVRYWNILLQYSPI